MCRSILGLLIAFSLVFQFAGAGWSQQTSEKAAQPAAGQQARPAEPARPAATEKKAETAVDPSGSWKWEFEGPDGNKMDFVLKLTWDGKKLDGKYTAYDNTTKVEQGKIEKDALSFVVRPEFGGNSFDVKFNGKVAKDQIEGATKLDFGGGETEFPWTAKRFVDADDVVGVWDLSIQSEQFGEVKATLTVTKDAKGLHAKYANEFFDLEAKNVQIKDNDFLFEIASDANAEFSFKSQYQGAPRGNSIEGKSKFDFGGNAGEMKFTGKRQPPKEEKKAEPARAEAARPAADAKTGGKEAAATPSSATKSDGK